MPYTMHNYSLPAGNGYVGNDGVIYTDCCSSRLGPAQTDAAGTYYCCSSCQQPIIQIGPGRAKQLLNGRRPGCSGKFKTIEGRIS